MSGRGRQTPQHQKIEPITYLSDAVLAIIPLLVILLSFWLFDIAVTLTLLLLVGVWLIDAFLKKLIK